MSLQCYHFCQQTTEKRKDIEELICFWTRGIIVMINGRPCSYDTEFGFILEAISNHNYMRSYEDDDRGTITKIYLDKVSDNF